MSTKTELLEQYKKLAEAVEAVEAKRKELDKNGSLSNQGRMEALERFIEEQGITAKATKLADDLEATADGLEKKWAEKTAERIRDKGYQDALAAAADAIAGGWLAAPRDLEAVAAMFAGDSVALARLDQAARSQGITVLAFGAKDLRERVVGNLERMASDVKSITPAAVKNDSLTASLKLQGNTEYLLLRVDDDFTPKAEQVDNG